MEQKRMDPPGAHCPRVVYFFSMDWKLVGNKDELAEGLELVTGIPATVLRFQQRPDDFSVAQRMSWAAKRETTRVEDEAYCLLGIFNVNMPTLYGEGKKAFERLQEAILAQTTDTTLFAWGRSVELAALDDSSNDARAGLLATSPFDYESSSAIRFASRSKIPEGSRSAHGSIQFEFNITPRGILTRIPLVFINGHTFADLSWSQGDYTLLLLLKLRVPRYIGALPLYDVGVISPPRHRWDKSPTRLSQIYTKSPPNDSSHPLESTWKLLYLQTRSYTEPETQIYLPLNHAFPPLFRLPEHLIAEFLRHEKGWRINNSQLPWLGNPPLTITFLYKAVYESLYVAIQFGRCESGSSSRPSFWANFRGSTSTADCGDGHHECSTDHILTWPNLEKKLVVVTHHIGSPLGERDMKWILSMSFTQSPRATGTGPLSLSHMSIIDHTLLKKTGYRDFIEEWELEKQERRNAQSAALANKNQTHRRRARNQKKGQEVRVCATAQEASPNSEVHSVEANTTLDASGSIGQVLVPPHCRIIRFLTGAMNWPCVFSCTFQYSHKDCFSPPLSAYLYDLPVIMMPSYIPVVMLTYKNR
ncbi:hypothetical protein C8Q74DRAFT_353739 [Fomes fomentarius]|nr:hypothetical protein C8Q74DRAFT_353739 [Fomes fomentarius]